jgi:hypothetical protein
VILFADPGIDAAGNANVTFDMTIRKPDGTLYIPAKTGECWRGGYSAASHNLQLSKGHMAIQIASGDPAGVYTIEVNVHDNIKKVDLPLKTTFEVPPAAPAVN